MQIAVVGAGIIGCAVAHELAARGADVLLVDRRGVAKGATWASAGVLAPWIEAHEHPPLLELCERSLAMYDAFMARVQDDAGVAVEYERSGTLDVALDEAQAMTRRETAASLAARGIDAAFFEPDAVRAAEPRVAPWTTGAIRVQGHGFVAATPLADALSVAARMRGAILRAPLDVTRIEPYAKRLRLSTSEGPLDVDRVVIASGSWANRLKAGGEDAQVRPVRGQLVRLRFDAPPVSSVLWSDDCYAVPWKDGTLLVGATMEEVGFDERTTGSGVAQLLGAIARVLPDAADATFVDARAGLRPRPSGAVPVIGPSPTIPGAFLAVGHFRNGILLAPLTAALVADQVLG